MDHETNGAAPALAPPLQVVKAASGKFHPLFQWFYFDSIESLPEEVLSAEEVAPQVRGHSVATWHVGAWGESAPAPGAPGVDHISYTYMALVGLGILIAWQKMHDRPLQSADGNCRALAGGRSDGPTRHAHPAPPRAGARGGYICTHI